MKKIVFGLILTFIFVCPAFSYQTPYQLKRLTPDDSFTGNTPNCWAKSYPQAVCEVNGYVYVGGDWGFVDRINISNWNIEHFLGQQGTRVLLTPGSDNDNTGFAPARVPDGVTDIKFDAVGNRLYMASWWYKNVMYYDFNTRHFDNFSGSLNVQGCQQGAPGQTLFNYPAYLDVKGNTVYVSDRDNGIIVGINIATQDSYIVAGQPLSFSVTDGQGLTSTVRFRSPMGIVATSDNSKLYVADPPYIRCIDLNLNSSATIASISANSAISGLAITGDDNTLYCADKGPGGQTGGIIWKIDLSNNNAGSYIIGGNGDNFTDPVVNTSNVKFRLGMGGILSA